METHLHQLHDLEVRHVDVSMLGDTRILLAANNALFEEVVVDQASVFLWHEHRGRSFGYVTEVGEMKGRPINRLRPTVRHFTRELHVNYSILK